MLTSFSYLLTSREYNVSEPNSILQENFCRNPNNSPDGPWCFTTDPTVQKETCMVPICGKYLRALQLYCCGCNDFDRFHPLFMSLVTSVTSPRLILIPGEIFVPPTLTPKHFKTVQSSCISNYGVDYIGDLDVSAGGHACLQWSSPEATALSQNKDFNPDISLPGNKCRNPDKDPEGPWCYVNASGKVIVDYCDLPLCGIMTSPKKVAVRPQHMGGGCG